MEVDDQRFPVKSINKKMYMHSQSVETRKRSEIRCIDHSRTNEKRAQYRCR